MPKKKKKKQTGTLKRAARLQKTKAWLATYDGGERRILRNYRKKFKVDVSSALRDLQEIGHVFAPGYVDAVLRSEEHRLRQKALKKQAQSEQYSEFRDDHFYYIAGYTSGGAPYGVTWEENGMEPYEDEREWMDEYVPNDLWKGRSPMFDDNNDTHSGAEQHVEPYDLTSIFDLKHALLVTVAAYRDYSEYLNTLAMLEENYDESIEQFETDAWLALEQEPEKVDDLIEEGYTVFKAGKDVFYQLAERAQENCTKVIKAVLSAPPATQKDVFGQAYHIQPQVMNVLISYLFDALDETDYHHSMPDNLNTFLEVMREQWKQYS